jgi:PEP-CTERM motif
MNKVITGFCVAAICATAGINAAQAAINATVYENVTSAANDALIANQPSNTGAYATFSVPTIDFNSATNGYTIGSFFNNPTFTGFNGFNANDTLNNTYTLFTGTTYLNAGANTFTTTHDDGFELSVPGVSFDLQQPGPTSPIPITYAITAPTAGFYGFTLAYGECCGPPATINFDVNGGPIITSSVPEPSTYAMLLAGLGLIGFIAYRRKGDRSSMIMAA